MGKSFKDCEGMEWKLSITAGSLLKACRASGLKLSEIMSMDVKIELLLEAIPYFCQKQLDERKMSHEDLLERIGMDEMKAIMELFFPALAESFPTQENAGEVAESSDAPLSLGNAKTS